MRANTLVLLTICLGMTTPIFARARMSGYCEDNVRTIATNTSSQANKSSQFSAGCTVTVYVTKTTHLATLYSDDNRTPRANPFTVAAADELWSFYVDEGTYDVRFSQAESIADSPLDPLWSNAILTRLKDSSLADTLHAADFGVVCDGTTDDTAALSKAVRMASSLQSKLTIQSGTCIVSPSGNQILPMASNIWIQGSGSATILKVKDGTGVYLAFFGPYGAGNITNFMLTDLTIDQNSLNAIPYSPANFRMIIGTSTGGLIMTIERVHVTNVEGINTFYSGTPYTTIRDCVFDRIGGSGVLHDYSAVYMAAEHSIIANNTFTARSVGSSVTAIETHGGKHRITGNVIDGMANGMNITGVAPVDSTNIVVSGNRISNADFGMVLYSFQEGLHKAGYGIDGAIITNNQIRITQNAPAYSMFHGSTGGIVLYPNAGLPVLPYRNVLISDNSIEFDTPSSFSNTAGFGIGYWDAAGGNTVTHLRILNNTIINCPLPGIRFSAEGSDIEISGNQVVNPGSSSGTLDSTYRAGIYIASKQPIGKLRVLNNNITDNQVPTNSSGVELLTGDNGEILVQGNTTSVTGNGRILRFGTRPAH